MSKPNNLKMFACYLRITCAEFVRNKIAAFWTYAFPVLMLVSFAAIFGTSYRLGEVTLTINDADETQTSRELTQAIQSVLRTGIGVTVKFGGSSGSGREDRVTLSIPTGFENAVKKAQPSTIRYADSGSNSVARRIVISVIAATLDRFWISSVLSGRDIQFEREPSISGERPSEEPNYYLYLITGLICMVVISTSLMGFAVPLVAMRQRGSLTAFDILPVAKLTMLSALLASRFMVVFSSALLLCVVGWLFYDFGRGVSLSAWAHAAFVLMLGSIGFLAFGVAVAARPRSVESAAIICNLLYFPLIFLGNLFIPLGPLNAALNFLPPNLMAGTMREILSGRPASSIELWFLLEFTAITVVSLLYSRRAFKWSHQGA